MSDPNQFGYQPAPVRLFDTKLQLDPEFMVMIRSIEARIITGEILASMRQPNWNALMPAFQVMAAGPANYVSAPPTPPGPATPAPVTRSAVVPDYVLNAGPPRAGDLADVTKAVAKLPEVQWLMGQAHLELDKQLRVLKGEWQSAPVSEKIVMVSIGTLVAAGTIAPILANQQTRIMAFDLLKGKDIPVPGVDGLSFKILERGGAINTPLGLPGVSAGGQLVLPKVGAPVLSTELKLSSEALRVKGLSFHGKAEWQLNRPDPSSFSVTVNFDLMAFITSRK